MLSSSFFSSITNSFFTSLEKNCRSLLRINIQESLSETGLDTYVTTGTGEKTVNKIFALDQFDMGNTIIKSAHFLSQDLEVFNQSMERPISGVLSLTALQSDDIVIDLQAKRIYF